MKPFVKCFRSAAVTCALALRVLPDRQVRKSTPSAWAGGSPAEGYAGPGPDDQPVLLKIRSAHRQTGQVKPYMLGSPHEITDRLFVAGCAFRVNDSLPEESAHHWQGQRGGWLLVDRIRTQHGDQSTGIRRVLFGSELVPRLCGVLWSW